MSDRYVKVQSSIWGSQRFETLSRLERLVYFYLLTNEHNNSLGLYGLKAKYALVDLKCTAKAYRETLLDLAAAGLIATDGVTETVLLYNYLRYNPFTSSKHAKGSVDLAAKYLYCPLYPLLYKEIERYCHRYAGCFPYPIDSLGIGYRYTETDRDTKTDTDTKTNGGTERAVCGGHGAPTGEAGIERGGGCLFFGNTAGAAGESWGKTAAGEAGESWQRPAAGAAEKGDEKDFTEARCHAQGDRDKGRGGQPKAVDGESGAAARSAAYNKEAKRERAATGVKNEGLKRSAAPGSPAGVPEMFLIGENQTAGERAAGFSAQDGANSGAKESGFGEFWQLYPRQEGKIRAERAWVAALKISTEKEIISACRDYCGHHAALGTELRYLKTPANWLEGRCWEDKLLPPFAKAGKKAKASPYSVLAHRSVRKKLEGSEPAGSGPGEG